MVLGGLYEERQFIIIPGEPNVTTSATVNDSWWLECNKGTAVHIFDTYDWEFKPEFDPDNKGSKVPPTIFNLVGGNETGGATLRQPTAGWDYEALGTIFSVRNQPVSEEETQFPPPNLNITSPTRSPQASPWVEIQQATKSNKNAIIGGVIGSLCMVGLSTGILIFFVKRSRKPSKLESNTPELDGLKYRMELQGTNYNCHGRYELYAYEPPEMGSEVVGSCSSVRGEEQAALPKKPCTSSTNTSTALTP